MSKQKQIVKDNYLEYIPFHSVKYQYETDDKGKVTILKENKGVFNRIFQKLFKKPKVTQIHLDKMGSFIWPLMDGNRSVLEIADYVKKEFGDKAEPLYERLAKYIQILQSYGFVEIAKEKNEKV